MKFHFWYGFLAGAAALGAFTEALHGDWWGCSTGVVAALLLYGASHLELRGRAV